MTLLSGCGALGLGDEEGGDPILVGTTDEVTSLDPAVAYDAGSWALISTLGQSLLTFQPNGSEPVPDAAETCEFTDDELTTYECTLRKGLTFANGEEITAEDVVFSFDRIKKYWDKEEDGTWPVVSTLKKTEAVGSDKVVFHLSTPDATWPFKLASSAGTIVSRESYPMGSALEGSSVVGSGPYVLKSYTKGKSAVLERNPKYKGALEVHNDTVEIRYYASSEKLSTAWKAKELDVVSRELPSEEYSRLESDPPAGVRLSAAKGSAVRHMVFNVRAGSRTKDLAVRRAISALVDRDDIAVNGQANTVIPLYSVLPAGVQGHTTPFYDKVPTNDPAEAEKILRDAGIPTPFTFTYAYRADSGKDQESKLLAKQLGRKGLFKVQLKPLKADAYFDMVSEGKTDAFGVGWLPDFPDPITYIEPVVGSANTYNNGFSDARVDGLIKNIGKVAERSRIGADLNNVDVRVAQELPLLPLYQERDFTLTTDHILGGENMIDSTGAWRVWELSRE
ncbi:ABC transporter substrate-binding protein [Streptomyces polyrhachis]|uniref:ABC transporter substrate-binding protein n=1 Tax=Streptomyces polyrhachis TaxID=1282885 RepID=A0ABW2GCL1_9ACTN